MTDHHDGLPGDEFADDGLDRSIIEAMRAEIPAPAADYWDRIDRTVAGIAHGSVGGGAPHDGSENRPIGADTAGAEVRLTDMETNTTTTQTFGSHLLARAAIVLVLVGLTAAAVAAIAVSRQGDGIDPAQPIENTPATSPTTVTTITVTTITETTTPETTEATEPVPSSEPGGPADAITVGSFTAQDVQDAGWEGIGCWLHPDADLGPDILFFMGWDGGFVLIDGEPVEMANTGGQSFGTTDDVFVGGGHRAEFVEVGDPTPSSIESTIQDVVLRITADDGRTTDVSGVLWCGV